MSHISLTAVDWCGFYYKQKGIWVGAIFNVLATSWSQTKNLKKALDNAGLLGLPCVAHTIQVVGNKGRLAQISGAHVEAVGAQASYYAF